MNDGIAQAAVNTVPFATNFSKNGIAPGPDGPLVISRLAANDAYDDDDGVFGCVVAPAVHLDARADLAPDVDAGREGAPFPARVRLVESDDAGEQG